MTTVPIKNQRASVPAVHRTDGSEWNDHVPAGSWNFFTSGDVKKAGILFGCPCDCGSLFSVDFHARPGRPVWHWDGNEAAPTVTPSILIYQTDAQGNRIGEHWHGFLTSGEFRFHG